MSLPTSLMADGIEKTMRLIHKELAERADGLGYRTHSGIPVPENLPDEPAGVWIAPAGLAADEDGQPFNSTYYVSQWTITFVRRATDDKPWETDYFEVYRDSGRLVEALTSSIDDMSLDGTVDFIREPSVQYFEGDPAGGSKRIVGFTMDLSAHHPLFPSCRT